MAIPIITIRRSRGENDSQLDGCIFFGNVIHHKWPRVKVFKDEIDTICFEMIWYNQNQRKFLTLHMDGNGDVDGSLQDHVGVQSPTHATKRMMRVFLFSAYPPHSWVSGSNFENRFGTFFWILVNPFHYDRSDLQQTSKFRTVCCLHWMSLFPPGK